MTFREIGSATLTTREVLIATDGYWRHPNGLLEQWGLVSLGLNSSTALAFPVVFPTICFNFVATPLVALNVAVAYCVSSSTIGVSGVTLMGHQISGGATTCPGFTAYWRALGY